MERENGGHFVVAVSTRTRQFLSAAEIIIEGWTGRAVATLAGEEQNEPDYCCQSDNQSHKHS